MTVIFLCLLLSSILRGADLAILLEDDFIHKSSYQTLPLIQEQYPENYLQIIEKAFYLKSHYEKNIKRRENEPYDHSLPKIPPVVHLIWLGPKKFPDLSVLDGWHQINPQYSIIIWTDRDQPLDRDFIEIKRVETLFPLILQKEFEDSNNWAEKADILRYEILDRFGGIYSDVDTICKKSFDPLIYNLSFFCGMESIAPLTNGVCLRVSNCLIGATAKHRMMRRTIEAVHRNWEMQTNRIAEYWVDFPPYDLFDFTKQLVISRTFLPFTEAVFSNFLQEDEAVLPHYYFGLSSERSTYARHLFATNWIEKKPVEREFVFTERIRKEIAKIYKNSLIVEFFSLSLLFLCGLSLFIFIKKSNKKIF